MTECVKSILYGVLEGITEWLPVSSTGHLILLEQVFPLAVSPEFRSLFDVVIQLGAIAAVAVLYRQRLDPRSPRCRALWSRVIPAVLPAALMGFLLDDRIEAQLFSPAVVCSTLVLYGLAFLLPWERWITPRYREPEALPLRLAMGIGLFQCLALVPGTSRSGATILGAMVLGLTREAGSEFSFFLAIPTMLGASLLKGAKFFLEGNRMTGMEPSILLIGCIVSFLVSLAVIRSLLRYVRTHSFAAFGLYRIMLGLAVLLWQRKG